MSISDMVARQRAQMAQAMQARKDQVAGQTSYGPNLINPQAMDPQRQGTFGTGRQFSTETLQQLGSRDPRDQGAQLDYGFALKDALGQGFQAYNDTARGAADLAMQYVGDVRGYQDAVNQREQYATGGWGALADSSRYYLGGNRDWTGNRSAMLDDRAAAMSAPSRYAPTIDAAAMLQGAASGRIGQVGDQFGGVANQFGGVANQIGGAATGAGYGGQMDAARGLYAMGLQPQGPSAAEMSMRQQAGQALQGQAALAAAGRGANAGLAAQNAAAANATTQGNLVSQLGTQRAAEDLAYRNQRMQALGAAAGAYGNAMGSQVSALGQQANVLGGQANVLSGQGQMYGAAGQMAGQAGQTALAAQQGELARDEAARAYYGMGNQLASTQLGANMAYDQNRTGNYLSDLGIRQAGRDAAAARDDSFAKSLIGGGLMAAGAIAAPFTGGASLAAVPAGAAISRG